MTLRIGDEAPDFHAITTQGNIKFHDWIGDSWAVLFSHPKDFTPICTTELGLMSRIQEQFEERGVKILGHSADSVEEHERWIKDIEELESSEVRFPIIGDISLEIAKLYDMLPASAIPMPNGNKRTPADNATIRAVFVIGPDKKIKLMSFYPMTVGRSFDEILRTIDSLQLTAKSKLVTPANWKSGDDVVIPPSISDEEAKSLFPQGWRTSKYYIRTIPQPTL